MISTAPCLLLLLGTFGCVERSNASSGVVSEEEDDIHTSPALQPKQPHRVVPNSMQCHPNKEEDSSFKCEFLVEQETAVTIDEGESEGESKALYCDNDKGFCIDVSVWNPENDAKERETTSSSTILLIQQFYIPPYEQYGEHVESVLQSWLASGEEGETEGEANYLTAEWWHQLGVAHRNQADQLRHTPQSETDTDEHNNHMDLLQQHVEWSSRSFRLALQYYEGLEKGETKEGRTDKNEEDDPWFSILKQIHIAIGYYNLADIMGFDPKQSSLDKEYFLHSEQIFAKHRQVLMDVPPNFEHMSTTFPYYYKDEDKSMASLWREARLYWAQGCSRLGVMELSTTTHTTTKENNDAGVNVMMNGGMMDLQNMAADVLQQSAGQMTTEEQLQTLQDLVSAELPKVLERTTRAETYFTQSVAVFRKILSDTVVGEQDMHTVRHLGNSLQNLGTTLLSKGESERGARHMEEALKYLEQTVQSFSAATTLGLVPLVSQVEFDDTQQAIGEILYGLADAYLQQGKYDESHERYDRAMEHYESNRIDPATATADPAMATMESEMFDQSIREYERALEEYQDLFAGGDATADIDEHGNYYQRDQGYEADIHSGLGALYISAGDFTEALVHISQALQLYKQNGETSERHYADLLINQSLLHFKMGEFLQSGVARYEALEIYRSHSGDGVNPLMDGIDMSSFQSMIDEAQRESGFPASDSGSSTRETTVHKVETTKQEVSQTGETVLGGAKIRIPDDGSNETDINEIMPIIGVH